MDQVKWKKEWNKMKPVKGASKVFIFIIIILFRSEN